MRICLDKNGDFQMKITPNSHKKLYMVENDKNKGWMVFSDLVKEISLGNVENARVYKNNIVFVKPELRVEKLDNKNIIRLKKHLRTTIERWEQEQGYDCFMPEDYAVLDFESYLTNLESKDYKKYIIGYKGNKIESVFVIDKRTFGLPFIYNIYCDNYDLLLKFCHIISDLIKDSIFSFDYLPEGDMNGFKFLNFDSNIAKGYKYILHSGAYITKYHENNVKNKIEEKYFPKQLDIRQVVVKRWKTPDVMKYLEKYETGCFNGNWRNESNMDAVAGFHYFNCRDVFSGESAKDYLVALYKGQIIGVMKYGLWDREQSVAYIDVLMNCRNKGIATLLIKELDKHLYPMYELHLTDESELGHKCGMAKLFKKYIKSTVVKDYEDLRGFR